jgi:hypothetical protein
MVGQGKRRRDGAKISNYARLAFCSNGGCPDLWFFVIAGTICPDGALVFGRLRIGAAGLPNPVSRGGLISQLQPLWRMSVRESVMFGITSRTLLRAGFVLAIFMFMAARRVNRTDSSSPPSGDRSL